jgi:ketosteroid isomerase-like protein
MTLSLPEPIADYFAADMAGDSSALARCFTEDGVVRDEGGTFTGTAAIEQWNTQAKTKYHYSVEPLSVNARDGDIVVIGRVAGDFPGSPITLQHVFRVAGNKIVSLEIR